MTSLFGYKADSWKSLKSNSGFSTCSGWPYRMKVNLGEEAER